MSTRPRKLVAIVGTGTEIGKTWAATHLIRIASQHGSVAARKPAQSFAAGDAAPTDADQLAKATGETPLQVCPQHRWYPLAMAPPMAADALAMPRVTLADLLTELQWPTAIDIGFVESAGGLCSPIAHDADNVQLLRALAPDQVVLVADAGLGTINAVRLCLKALTGFDVTVFLNRFDVSNTLHVRNREWLRKHYGVMSSTTMTECWTSLTRAQ